jgi:hypothetical protein
LGLDWYVMLFHTSARSFAMGSKVIISREHFSLVPGSLNLRLSKFDYNLRSERSRSESSDAITCECTDDGVRKTDVEEATL